MSEHFLEEQLKRIREMSERVTRLRSSAAELSEEFERDRASASRGPLQEVRDLRTYSSIRSTADDADDHGARHSPRHTSRNRRK